MDKLQFAFGVNSQIYWLIDLRKDEKHVENQKVGISFCSLDTRVTKSFDSVDNDECMYMHMYVYTYIKYN